MASRKSHLASHPSHAWMHMCEGSMCTICATQLDVHGMQMALHDLYSYLCPSSQLMTRLTYTTQCRCRFPGSYRDVTISRPSVDICGTTDVESEFHVLTPISSAYMRRCVPLCCDSPSYDVRSCWLQAQSNLEACSPHIQAEQRKSGTTNGLF